MNQLVNKLKDNEQDFEWYPTTDAMINVIKKDLAIHPNKVFNILDCGAGDGRVLKLLTDEAGSGCNTYAIEKSTLLIQNMDKEIVVVGTDFHRSALIDKKMDVIFCNPPYSEYEVWTTKVIREAHAEAAYLIIPTRWKESGAIAEALESRKVEATVIHTSDFLDAERTARAKVDIIRVSFKGNLMYDRMEVDPFDLWFDTNFKVKAKVPKPKAAPQDMVSAKEKTLAETIDEMVAEYKENMISLHKNYLGVCELDPTILSELDVSVEGLKKALKQRIKGLKNKYWKKLFENYTPITSKLTSSSRKSMLEKLTDANSVDFDLDNVYAITIWAIKNANSYYDSQLVDLVSSIVDKANVVRYKSNKTLFDRGDWYYRQDSGNKFGKFGLERRMVLDRYSAIKKSDDMFGSNYHNNLSKYAHDFLCDIITVASNLGFIPAPWARTSYGVCDEWKSGKSVKFASMGKHHLMEVRAFKNGNLHIKFNQQFIKTLNIEFGRLKGWIKTPQDAADEMDVTVEEAKSILGKNMQIGSAGSLLQLTI